MISLKNPLPKLNLFVARVARNEETYDWDKVLGMNARNGLIEHENPYKAIRLVNDKYATKAALAAKGIPVTPTWRLSATASSSGASTGRRCLTPGRSSPTAARRARASCWRKSGTPQAGAGAPARAAC